jgi:hypothetical protein
VAELTETVALSGSADGTRVISRCESLHLGAQQTLDDDRSTAFLTDETGQEFAEFNRRMRAQARFADRMTDPTDKAGSTLGLGEFVINAAWRQLTGIATNLLAWLAAPGLPADDPTRRARPATIRYRLLHLGAKVTHGGRRAKVAIDADWPWAEHDNAPTTTADRQGQNRQRQTPSFAIADRASQSVREPAHRFVVHAQAAG